MKIYTKTGDQGKTSLLSGKRVSKTFPSIEAYGTIDELNSVLGLVTENSGDKKITQRIYDIQNQLFSLASHLSCDDTKLKESLPRLNENWILELENDIDNWEKNLNPLKNFILPGGSKDSCFLHLARTVSRRAERRIIDIDNFEVNFSFQVRYLNRLSDWLFVAARFSNSINNIDDVPWKKP